MPNILLNQFLRSNVLDKVTWFVSLIFKNNNDFILSPTH